MEASIVCPYCGVGCKLKLVDSNAVGANGVSGGMLCARGRSIASGYLESKRRLRRPLVRVGSELREASWSEALEKAAKLLRDVVAAHGGWDAVGFIGGSKLFNEEAFALQKLARMLGSPHVDTCSRLCHFPTLSVLVETLGFGGLTAPLSEMLDSQAILVVGWNGAVTAPVLFARYVLGAVRRGAKLVAVDVWRSETARAAHVWLRVYPRGDSLLLAALARVLADRGIAPEAKENIENLDEVLASLAEIDPEATARAAGSDPALVEEAARLLDVERGSVLWGMGLTQHVEPRPAISWAVTIAALRGWLWRRGCVVGGVRGQANVQGVNDMGVLPEFLPGYQRVDDPEVRKIFEEAWGVKLPESSGLPETMMLEEAGRRVRAMVIFAENSGASHPSGVEQLSKLDALIVVDVVRSETAELADVVLPAAAWGEKEGSATNTEGRVQWSSAVREPPAESKPDLVIIKSLAERLGVGEKIPWSNPREVHPEIERLVPRYRGFSKAVAERGEYLLPRRVSRIRVRLYPPVEPVVPDGDRKVLVTARDPVSYCTNAMLDVSGELYARVNPKEAGAGHARLETERGAIRLRLIPDENVPEGIIVAPWHYGLNAVLPRRIDCATRIMELKSVWVKLAE
ncbi:molybdopterin oxidoreductase family protein [Pyrolobus fumarii]|uniref:molybdopterin oxidoreductase family protein n=1 Tax=Pyrolobus fumarii TaxID=54252 RepID=UPI00068C704D|nr:molybdopterin-dependent oxidoreductase [Pyrolobus fumarii]